MQNGGFLDTRTNKPIGLGIVIAAHAAVLAAIALAPPDIVTPWKTFTPQLIPIAADKEPPPPPPPSVEPARPTTVDSVIRTASNDTGPVIAMEPVKTVTPPLPIPIDPPKAEPKFVQAGMDPSAMARFQPDYPLSLIRAGVEGSATVRVLIASDGRVKAVELVNASDPAFFEATRKQALRFWRFKAATTDGVATESWRTMTVRFKLQS